MVEVPPVRKDALSWALQWLEATLSRESDVTDRTRPPGRRAIRERPETQAHREVTPVTDGATEMCPTKRCTLLHAQLASALPEASRLQDGVGRRRGDRIGFRAA